MESDQPAAPEPAAEVPSAEDQLKMVREVEKTEKLEAGGKAYLIDSTWYKSWQKAVGYYTSYGATGGDLPKIDNSSIWEGTRPKKGMLESTDYSVLVKGVWDLLVGWYGGGPVAEVDVVYDSYRRTNVALVQFVSLKAVYGEETKELDTAKSVPVKQLKERVMKLFNVPEDKETRLIDWWNGRWTAELKDDEMLSRYNLVENQQILLDDKDENGKWKHSSYSSTSTASSGYYYGSYGTYRGPGKVGFRNLGNTCFFNSGVQCLMHTMSLVNVFLNTNWQADLNVTNRLGSGGRVVKAFANLAKEVWRGNSGVVEPSDLKYEIGHFASQFAGWGQQDSHELITSMLDAIHEDLNRRKTKPQVESVSGDSTNDLEVAEKSWENHKARNDSVIVDRCHALLRSRLDCPNCKKTTVVFDPYASIPLPLQKMQLQKVRGLFVPLNPKEKYVEVVLMLPSMPKPDDVSAAVSKVLGRQVSAVLAAYSSSGDLTWNNAGDSDSGYSYSYSYSSKKFIIFEVADKTRFWVPCVITMEMYNQWKTYKNEDFLYGPFLVPLDDDKDVTEERVAEAAQSFLSWIWEGPKEEEDSDELTDSEGKFIERLVPPNESFGEGVKFQATMKKKWNDNTGIEASKTLPFVANKLVALRLSSDYVTKESGFDLGRIVHMMHDVESIDKGHGRGGSGVTLDQCFEFFAASEVLDEDNKWFCPNCREFVCATKKMDVWSVPDVLIIQLKRFIGGGWSTKKLDMNVDYPDEIDMSQYIVGPQKGTPQRYKFYAVSEHMGGLGGGHYIAHAAVQDATGGEQWYEFNDSSVSSSTREDAHSQLAYVLFYVREGSRDSIMSQWGSAQPQQTVTAAKEEEESSDPSTSSDDSMGSPD